MLPENPSAKEVCEYLLDCTSKTMMSGAFEDFAKCFSIPHEIHTFEGTQTLENIEDTERVYRNVRAFYHSKGVTDIVRHCIEAAFDGPDTLKFVYETRLINGTSLIQKPYPGYSVAKMIDGRWQLVRSEYAVTNAKGLSDALTSAGSDKPKPS